LDASFPNRWIGRDGPTPWPPRSPDITPLEFFLWGYVKDKLFSTPVPDITNLKARITDAFATITEDILENTWRETDNRLELLELSYILKKKNVCIPRRFLVIYVCSEGKNLCSPCISRSVACLALPYFPHYLIKATTFGKKLLNIKCVV